VTVDHGPSDARARRCRENLGAVRDRIVAACRQAGRPVDSVTLVGVTKYVDADLAGALLGAGCIDLAESRPQQLWEKAAALAGATPAPRWHLVGHLQRNKVRRTLPVVSLIHTVDSPRLLATLEAEAALAGRHCDILVEVNLAGDPGRSGVAIDDAAAVVAAAASSAHVRLRGLMGMASHPDGAAADARRDFARLRELRDRLARDVPPGILAELSMGMSGDFEVAILEGSTIVRVGSALFEGIDG
jgi:PLP dependent protein